MSVIFVVFYPRPPCMQVTGEAAALLFLADLSSQSIRPSNGIILVPKN